MRKKQFMAGAAALAMAAITVFSVGGNLTFAQNNIDKVAAQSEQSAEEAVISVTVSSDAWNYNDTTRVYGTWKVLNIKVADKMYQLSKDNAVNITFHNGDVIRVYAGDSYELWNGTIDIQNGEIDVTPTSKHNGNIGTTNWGCNLTYSAETGMVFEKGKDWSGGGGVAYGSTRLFYDYDFTAKKQDGTPIEGVSVVEEESATDRYYWDAMLSTGFVKNHNTWGNGNSFDVEAKTIDEELKYIIKSTRVTDENGTIDKYLPKSARKDNDDFSGDVYIGGDISISLLESGKRRAFVSDGLVNVTANDEYYTTPEALGLKASFNTMYTDKILGGCYYVSDKSANKKSNTITLKDPSGNDIASITMHLNEIVNTHLIGKNDEGKTVATGIDPLVYVKIAPGANDWYIMVDCEDNTYHITAEKRTCEVDLEDSDSQVISADKFKDILAQNVTKDVVIKTKNDVTFTFKMGTMADVDGKNEYDFSTSVVDKYEDSMSAYVTKDNFIAQIKYNYSGKLPAMADIRFKVGTQYAGQTLYYSYIKEDNTLAEVQAIVVDEEGYVTVKQDHCSSYVVTSSKPDTADDNTDIGNNTDSGNNSNSGNTTGSDNDVNADNGNGGSNLKTPETGDVTPIAMYVIVMVAAMGVIVFVKKRKMA